MALLFIASPIEAEPVTGNQLLSACSATEDAQLGFCAGYIASMIEGLSWGSAMVAHRLDLAQDVEQANDFNAVMLGYCIPQQADNGQIADLVIKALEQTPETRHLPARGLIVEALQGAFPCE